MHAFLASLWEHAELEQTVNTGEGRELVRRRTIALTQWGWYRDRDELVISEVRFTQQYRQEPALYPFRATKMMKLAFKALRSRKDVVAVLGSSRSVTIIDPLKGGVP